MNKRVQYVAGLLLGTAVSLAGGAGSAGAAVTEFSNRVDFNTAVAGYGIQYLQDFDGTTSETVVPNGTSLDGITFSYTTPYAGNHMRVTATSQVLSSPNNLGVRYVGGGYTSGFAPQDNLTLTFPEPVTAFGVYFITGALPDGSNRATTSNGDVVLSHYDPVTSGGYGQFLGLISDTPFTSVVLKGLALHGYNIDNVTAATVPEPSAGVLLAISLGGPALMRRKRGQTRQA